MEIKDFFGRTYAINLPSRRDRRRMIVRELNKAGMPLESSKVEIFPGIQPNNAGDFPSIGVKGCFLSHLAILKQVKNNGLANVLIVEDDLTISKQFKTEQELLVAQLCQTDWGFVYFGHIEEEHAEASSVKLRPFFKPLMTAHFYAVNSKILDRLIPFLEELQQRPGGHPDGGPMHLDGAYSTFRVQNPDVVTLIASPNLGWQRSSRSDISPKLLDRTPILNQLVGIMRMFKALLYTRR